MDRAQLLEPTRYATISAELAEGARPAAEVLAAFELDEAAWADLSRAFGEALAEDAGRDGALAIAFSQAFAAHQDRLRPAPPLSVEQWAALEAEIEAWDSPAAALATFGLTLPDYFRLARRFATMLSRDPELEGRHAAARERLEQAEDAGGEPK